VGVDAFGNRTPNDSEHSRVPHFKPNGNLTTPGDLTGQCVVANASDDILLKLRKISNDSARVMPMLKSKISFKSIVKST
jgi:hypothetical protein